MKINVERLGAAIKSTRERRGVTQVQAAEAIGIAQNSVSFLERGKYPPSLQNYALICDWLGVSLDEFTETESLAA